MSAPDAEARSRYKRGYHSGHHRVSASFHVRRHAVRHHRAVRSAGRRALGADSTPMFASIVVDANSGRMLSGRNENELRHPASITKVMTLYLLFEQLEKGRLKLDSDITISAHAASQAPSKLGLRPGATIEVEDAIKALVTKSANDIAVAVAESVGGDEDTFAGQMTRKARALGMSRTIYRNASGLPDDGAGHDRARSQHSGPRAAGPLPEILPLFLDPGVQLWTRRASQPQSSAGPR